jgi:hypothetical protein
MSGAELERDKRFRPALRVVLMEAQSADAMLGLSHGRAMPGCKDVLTDRSSVNSSWQAEPYQTGGGRSRVVDGNSPYTCR